MKFWLRFLAIGLILGLFTEFQLKLNAGIRPKTFIITLFAYPVLVTLSYGGHRLISRGLSSVWAGDVLHYLASGVVGLIIEWTVLGNPPQAATRSSWGCSRCGRRSVLGPVF